MVERHIVLAIRAKVEAARRGIDTAIVAGIAELAEALGRPAQADDVRRAFDCSRATAYRYLARARRSDGGADA